MKIRDWICQPVIQRLELNIAASECRLRQSQNSDSTKVLAGLSKLTERNLQLEEKFVSVRGSIRHALHCLEARLAQIEKSQAGYATFREYDAVNFAIGKQEKDHDYQATREESTEEAIRWASYWLAEHGFPSVDKNRLRQLIEAKTFEYSNLP